ncbi:hypothetical protein STEG23_023768 [Scotinomys teguina]
MLTVPYVTKAILQETLECWLADACVSQYQALLLDHPRVQFEKPITIDPTYPVDDPQISPPIYSLRMPVPLISLSCFAIGRDLYVCECFVGIHCARQVCRTLRHLDQCEHQIKPQETKFHLLNSAQIPLFHCNCTRRCSRDYRAIKVSARHLQRLQQKRLRFWDKGTYGTVTWPLEPSGTSMSFYSQCLQLTLAIWRAGGQKTFQSSGP